MISRTYSVITEGEVAGYKGFNRSFKPSQMDLIAVVLVEGEVELYVLDDDRQARTELVRYLTEQSPQAVIAGVYRRT